MTPKEYQPILKTKLKEIYKYKEVKVEIEWSSMKGDKNIYSPRVDAAVSPFALNQRFRTNTNQSYGPSMRTLANVS